MWFLLPVVTQLDPSYFWAATMAPSTTLVSITLATGSPVVSACACVIVSQFFDFGDFTLSGLDQILFLADMQKFPLRMKDNDLLVTELYHDPSNDAITALSVYLTPKTSMCSICNLFFIFKLKIFSDFGVMFCPL